VDVRLSLNSLISSYQVHPGSHKLSLRPACNYKLVYRYAYSWLQDAESFLRSWWYLTWTRRSSFFMDSHNLFERSKRVLRLCLLLPTRTSSITYSTSLTSTEYYASIYSQVFQRGLFYLRFQNKTFHVLIPIACVLYNQPSPSSSLIWLPQIQMCKLWSSALRKSNYSPRSLTETVVQGDKIGSELQLFTWLTTRFARRSLSDYGCRTEREVKCFCVL